MRFKLFLSLLLIFGGLPFLAYGQNDFLLKVFDRSVWFRGDEFTPNISAIYKKPELIILHDLECPVLLNDGQRNPNCNSDTADSLSIIYNTYLFHKYVKKYGDIGYHFIIDRLGNVYRGRDGQNGINGADTYDENECVDYDRGSISIALIGNYEQETIPLVQYEALKKLTALLVYANNLSPITDQIMWQGKKINGLCSPDGSFKYNYKGSTIIRHSDLDKSHKDLASLDLNKFRYEVFEEAKKYSNYLFLVKDQDSVKNKLYKISEGKLIEKEKIGNFVLSLSPEIASFFELDMSQTIYDNIDIYKLENIIIKVRGRPFYYLIKNGQKNIIIPELLNLKPYQNLRKIELDEVRLLDYPVGDPVQLPDGFLVKQKGDYKIYYSQNGFLHHITSSVIMKENKDLAKLPLVEIEPTNFKLLKIGAPIYLPDGTLVKTLNSFKTYYLEKGKKRLIISYDVFKQYKFSQAKIIILPDDELKNIPLGEPFYHKDGTFLKTANNDNIYYIEGGTKFQINNQTLLFKLGFNYKNIRVVDMETLNYYRDGGTLFNESDLNKVRQLLVNFKNKNIINPEIRVLLKEYQLLPQLLNETIKVTANGPFILINGENKVIESFRQDNTIILRIGDILRNYNLPLVFKGENSDIILEFGFSNASTNDYQISKLRGEILITYNPFGDNGNGSFLIINKVKMEDYLKGIAGFSSNDKDEFLKTAITALRSYVLAKFYATNFFIFNNSFDVNYYDIKKDEEGLVYVGYDNEALLPNLVKAVEETNGYVLWYNDDIALARFSLDTGGVSKDARKIFGDEYEKYPFLWGGVEDLPSTKHIVDYIKTSHGVGLSLQGAREMALYGFNMEVILSKYYFNTEVKKIY